MNEQIDELNARGNELVTIQFSEDFGVPRTVVITNALRRMLQQNLNEYRIEALTIEEPAALAAFFMTKRQIAPYMTVTTIEDTDTIVAVDNAEAAKEEPEVTDEIDATKGAIDYAQEYGVTLSDVVGTGSNGRITKGDVVAFVEAL